MNKKSLYLLVIILLFNGVLVYSQKVLIDESPLTPYPSDNWGPNRLHHVQLFGAYGQFFDFGDFPETQSLFSSSGQFSMQYKIRLASLLAIIAEGGFHAEQYKFMKDELSPIDLASYDREQLKTQAIQGVLGIRINPDFKRGNIIGKYLEFGIYNDYIFSSRHISRVSSESTGSFYKQMKTTEKGLNYIIPWQYGITARVGINNYSFFYSKRLSKMIDTDMLSLVLPNQTIGIKYSVLN